MRHWVVILFICFFISSCQTARPNIKSQQETSQDVESALKTVAGAVKGSPLTDDDVKKLNKQIRQDKEAQSAVSTITNTMGGQARTIKYCPIDGKRFAATVQTCPDHGVELRWVDE